MLYMFFIELILLIWLIYSEVKKTNEDLVKKTRIRNVTYDQLFSSFIDLKNGDKSPIYYLIILILCILMRFVNDTFFVGFGFIIFYEYYLILREKSKLVRQLGFSFSKMENYFLMDYMSLSIVLGVIWCILNMFIIYFLDPIMQLYSEFAGQFNVTLMFAILILLYLLMLFSPIIQLNTLKKTIIHSSLAYCGNFSEKVLFLENVEFTKREKVLKRFLTNDEEKNLEAFSKDLQKEILEDYEKTLIDSKFKKVYLNLLSKFFLGEGLEK